MATTIQNIDGDETQVSHIEVWFDYSYGDWCSDLIDENGYYIEATADYAATRQIAIARAKDMFPSIDIHVFGRIERNLLWIIGGRNG
tara:strand:- start:411 stop:671 length:261 start_codon:yes stop_codon:yes gene_type:complete